MRELAGRLQDILDGLAERHGVPGAVLGVIDSDGTATAAVGVANCGTGVAMTADTGFLIGSVTKVWVSTLVMTLVDRCELDLDASVRTYLPGFRLADPAAAEAITVRHLLTHASGIDGADHAPDDLGSGPEVVGRYVDGLTTLSQLHPPGVHSSYCNPGFVVAGRLIETITGVPFADAFRNGLLRPLGLGRSFLSTEEAILHRIAVGHFPDRDGGPPRPTPRFLLPHALGPAGSTFVTTVSDALTFARLHLEGGVTSDGRRLLSTRAAADMAALQQSLPVPELGGYGLGWLRREHRGRVVLSHLGGSLGGLAQLVAVPGDGVALAAYANSSGSAAFHEDLRREVLEGVFGLALDGPFVDHEPRPSPSYFAGTYRRREADVRIDVDGDGLLVTNIPTTGVLAVYEDGESTFRLQVLGGRTVGVEGAPLLYGVGSRDGHPEFVLVGGRLARRVAP